MSDSFFTIEWDFSLPPAEPPKTALTHEQQDDLMREFMFWHDADFIAAPLKRGGGKWPALPGCGTQRVDGSFGYGWARLRDGEAPPLTDQQFFDLVRGNQTHGIGILLNSDLEMVELEGRGRPLLRELAAAAERLGESELLEEMVQGLTEESPSGGLHFHLRVPDGPPGRKHVLARRGGELIAEVIGRGGLFVAAPSAGLTHATGRPYRRLLGSPSNIICVTPDERERIYGVFRYLDDSPSKAPQEPREDCPLRAWGPVEKDFHRQVTWSQILKPHGWTLTGSNQSAGVPTESWRRHGKREGHSATTMGGTLCCFSSNAGLPQFEQPLRTKERGKNSLSKFEVYAYLNHTGDMEAAERDLTAKGFGKQAPEWLDRSGRPEAEQVVGEQVIQMLEAAGTISLSQIEGLAIKTAPLPALVDAANRERAATGRSTIPKTPLPERTDPRLKSGLPSLATAVIGRLCEKNCVTYCWKTKTLTRRSA